MKKTIRLERPSEANGKPVFWQVDINGVEITESWGYVIDGKVQSKTTIFEAGKNVGRANETTPEEQALRGAERKARKKMEEKNYKLVKGELNNDNAPEYVQPDLDIPLPMLAKKYEDQKNKITGMIYLQEKLDGNRCVVNRTNGKMYSRNRKEIKHLSFIGEAVIKATKGLDKNIIWIDGELFTKGMSFNDTQTIIRSAKNVDEEMANKMEYHIFDIISLLPWSKRRVILMDIKESSIVHVVKDKYIKAEELNKYHDEFVNNGYEGAIIRLDGFGYEHKRSSSLIKYKKFKDDEFKIIGFKSEKHDDDLLGSITMEMKDGQTFDARPACTVEEKADMWKNQKKYIGKMATIKYQELDGKSGIPRFPVFKHVRIGKE
jgi:DNA ligase-1